MRKREESGKISRVWGRDSRRRKFPSTEMRKAAGRTEFRAGETRGDWEFSFGLAEIEMPIKCPREYVKYTAGYMSLEFAEDLNLEVISELSH